MECVEGDLRTLERGINDKGLLLRTEAENSIGLFSRPNLIEGCRAEGRRINENIMPRTADIINTWEVYNNCYNHFNVNHLTGLLCPK